MCTIHHYQLYRLTRARTTQICLDSCSSETLLGSVYPEVRRESLKSYMGVWLPLPYDTVLCYTRCSCPYTATWSILASAAGADIKMVCKALMCQYMHPIHHRYMHSVSASVTRLCGDTLVIQSWLYTLDMVATSCLNGTVCWCHTLTYHPRSYCYTDLQHMCVMVHW